MMGMRYFKHNFFHFYLLGNVTKYPAQTFVILMVDIENVTFIAIV